MTKRRQVTVFGIIFALLTIWSLGVYTVKEGTVGVIDTFGQYSPDEVYPGLHFKIPFVQGITIMDIKTQTVNFKYDKVHESQNEETGIMQVPRIVVLDAKNLEISFDISVQYTPNVSDMDKILSNYGKNYFNKKLSSTMRSSLRDSSSNYNAETISIMRTELGTVMNVDLANAISGLPFTLEKVHLRAITLPAVIRDKVIAVQEAKQEEQRLDQVEKQALVTKRIGIINAERTADVARLLAKGKADANIEKAIGESTAIKLLALEQANANKLISSTLTANLIQQNWVQQWNGIQPKYMLAPGANMLLNIGK